MIAFWKNKKLKYINFNVAFASFIENISYFHLEFSSFPADTSRDICMLA